MWLPSLINREMGINPESNPRAWERDLMNGYILQFRKLDREFISSHRLHIYDEMEICIFNLLLKCDTSFYDLFISELTKLFCLFDLQHGHLRVDELAKPLAKNVRALITPERYVPYDFLHLETMVHYLD